MRGRTAETHVPRPRAQKAFQTLDRALDIPVQGLNSVVQDGHSAHIATSGCGVDKQQPEQRHFAQ